MKVTTRKERLDAAGAGVIFVVHDEPDLLRRTLLAGVDCPWPVAVDLDRERYRTWGLRRAGFFELYADPSLWKAYAKLLVGGERIRGTGRDVRQLGGDFVVGADGRLVYSRPQRSDDRPPVGELVAAIEACARG